MMSQHNPDFPSKQHVNFTAIFPKYFITQPEHAVNKCQGNVEEFLAILQATNNYI